MGSARHHVVIVGGGFGGLTTARALRGKPVRVTLVDKRNFHLFQPLLYQVATGLLCPSEVASPLRYILKDQRNSRVLLGEVVDFDPARRHVVLADGGIDYDTLIVAAGMVNHYHGHDDWQPYAPGLKTIEDTAQIRQRIFFAFEVAEREPDPAIRREWLTFVVIGGGATGVELAGMIAEVAGNVLGHEFPNAIRSQCRVLLLDAAERIFPAFPPELAALAERKLADLGVTVRSRTRVVKIGEGAILIEKPEGRERIAARTAIWASGVFASPLGGKLAMRTAAATDRMGRVIVNPDLTVPGHPEIFVIGDLGHFAHQGGRPLAGVAPVATQQGRYVAALIGNRLAGRKAAKRFSYFDKGTLAVMGRDAAIADIGKWHFGGRFAWFLWLCLHLLLLIQFENRVIVLIRWAFHYLRYNYGARDLALQGTLRLPISDKRPAP